MNRKISISLAIGLIAIMILLNGCALKDYLTGGSIKDSSKNKVSSEENELSELESLDKEISDIEKKTTTKKDTKTSAKADNTTKKTITEKLVSEEAKPSIEIKVKENDTVSLKPKVSDKNKDKVTYTFSEPLDKDGKWKTTFGDAGKYVITVTASDGELQTARKVLLIVEKRNMPPVITLKSDTLTVDEGTTLDLNNHFTVSDPNKDNVSVKISDPVGDKGIWKIGYRDAGNYTIVIEAFDGEMRSKKELKLNVNKKNMAPEITGVPSEITVNEGEKVKIEPKVTDLNGDKVTVTISDPVGNDGVWETGYTDRGTYRVIVKATDGTATTTKEVKLIVKPVNIAPEILDIVQG